MAADLHFLERFENHKTGLKLQAGKFHEVYDKVIGGLTKICGVEAALETMSAARQAMVYCRQTLSCTYAFAYFLSASLQQVIFESNQEDLEKHLGEPYSHCRPTQIGAP
jgi:hypothetical protein